MEMSFFKQLDLDPTIKWVMWDWKFCIGPTKKGLDADKKYKKKKGLDTNNLTKR